MSTIFLNIRSLYDKKDFGKPVPQLLQYVFFITFTLLRMVFFPFGFYYLYKQYSGVGVILTIFQKFCYFYGLVMYILMFFLNVFWYYLILKRLRSLLRKKDNNY